MAHEPERPPRRRFDDFALDPYTLELTNAGRPVPLEPLPTRILARLLESPGEMITREELRVLGWPKLPRVADDSLNTCIRQIREALADDARAPRYVETLRGRGYRFLASVRDEAPPPRRRHRRRRLAWATAAAATGLLVLRGPSAIRPETPAAARELLARIEWAQERTFDWSTAMTLADSAVRTFPGVAEAHARHAELSLMAGRREVARRSTDAALALDPDNPSALRALAHLELLDGRRDAAVAALDAALRTAPDDPRTWISMAYHHTVLGSSAAAEDAIGRALELDPLSPLVIGDAGLLHLWGGRYALAGTACARAIEVEPRATWAIDCAFDAYRFAGDGDAAAAWALRWLAAGSESGGHLAAAGGDPVERVLRERVGRAEASGSGDYALAQALADVGRTGEALDALERAARRPGLAVLGAAVDPRLAPLRAEPRFLAVVRALGVAS